MTEHMMTYVKAYAMTRVREYYKDPEAENVEAKVVADLMREFGNVLLREGAEQAAKEAVEEYAEAFE